MKTVTRKELKKTIRQQLHSTLLTRSFDVLLFKAGISGIYIGDEEYVCPSLDEVKKILEDSQVDQRRYWSNGSDCEDFGFRLKADFVRKYLTEESRLAYAFGMVWGNKPAHAMNFVLCNDSKIYLIEPQDDKIHELDYLKQIYLAVV